MSKGQHAYGAIDRALIDKSHMHTRGVLSLCQGENVVFIAERVSRRATQLCRRHPRSNAQILKLRDGLIQSLYGRAVPEGWFAGWSDGSVIVNEQGQFAGIGGVIMNCGGKMLPTMGEAVGERDPFAVEASAVSLVLRAAFEHGAERIKVYTDCGALADLWHKRRYHVRLAEIRAVAVNFKKIEIAAICRQHNQPAHRLAKSSALIHPRRSIMSIKQTLG